MAKRWWTGAGVALLGLAACGGGDEELDVLDDKAEVAAQLYNATSMLLVTQFLGDAARFTENPPAPPRALKGWSARAVPKATLSCPDGGTRTDDRFERQYQGPFQQAPATFSVLRLTYNACREDTGTPVTDRRVIDGVTEGGRGPESDGLRAATVDYGPGAATYRVVTTEDPEAVSPGTVATVDISLHEDDLEGPAGRLSSLALVLDGTLSPPGAPARHLRLGVGTEADPAGIIVSGTAAVPTYTFDFDLTVTHDFGSACPLATIGARTPGNDPLRFDHAQFLFVGGTVILTRDGSSVSVQYQSNGDATVDYGNGRTETLTRAEQDAFAEDVSAGCGG